MKKPVRIVICLLLALCAVSFLAFSGSPAPASDGGSAPVPVTALISELETDPAIREMVDRYAPDPQQWWAWYETLPERSESEFSKISALEWVELFSLQSEDGREGLYYDLLQLPAALAKEN